MKHAVEKLAEAAGAQLLGNGKVEISGIASLESATANDLVFVEAAEDLGAALESPAAAVVAGEFARGVKAWKPLLIAQQPRLAFARAGKVICPPRRREPGIASTAFVHDSVKMGKLVSVEPGCYIGEGTVIGDRTRIGVGGFIAPRVTLGADCSIKAHVTIYSDSSIGNRVVVQAGAVLGSDGFGFVRDEATGAYEKFPQVGRLEIGDDVEIGANVTIARGALDATVIGSGCKLDSQVHVGHNVRMGKNVVIAAQTGISGSVVIEDNVVIAGQVGIADHVRIKAGAILGAQCGIPSHKQLAVLARLGKKER